MKHQFLASAFLTLLLLILVGGLCLAQEGDPTTASNPSANPDAIAAAVNTSFTYQGSLLNNGVHVNGTCDFVFTLWDAATLGRERGSNTLKSVAVADGIFTVPLDYGVDAFTGDARWLQIEVTCGHAGSAVLSPRQPLTAAPYALGLRPGAIVSAATSSPALSLSNTTGYALEISSVGSDGIRVTDAGANGVNVNHAAKDGLFVCTTGSATSCQLSSENNGVEVGNAEDNGIFVKAAGNDGVVVSSATDDGVYVNTADDDGLHVGLVQNGDGLQVDNAPSNQGVRVLSAWGGFFVDAAASRGLTVVSSGSPSTTSHDSLVGNGVDVEGAERYGLRIGRADDDGVHVASAGDHGVYVGTTTDAGLYVNSAGSDGVYINSASGDGVRVNSAAGDGVEARTSSISNYGGRFSNGAGGGAALFAIGGGNDAPDIVLGGTSGGDDGRIYSQPDLTGSDILMFSNDNFHIHLDEDNNSTGSGFVIYDGAGTALWSVLEGGTLVANGTSAQAVDAGAAGQELVYAINSPQNWLEDFGSGELLAGEAVVALDNAYATLISSKASYHVFLTPLGDCPLYVAQKGPASFTVRALGGATCGVGFDYRVVGLRAGSEATRLERYTPASAD